ncbi:MAG: TolB family protein [Planctomycetota bacterium]|jgi:Tol biopolymer transport system component
MMGTGSTTVSGVMSDGWGRAGLACVMMAVALLLSSCGGGGAPSVVLKDGLYLSARPTLTPNGRRILFSAVRGGESRIYSMELDGSKVLPVSVPRRNLHSPLYSDDGQWLTFVAEGDESGRGVIGVCRSDGSQLTVYPRPEGRFDRYPSFSPNSQVLVFQRSESVPTAQEFWLRDRRTGTERLLRNDDAWNPTPQVFRGDGRAILFAQMEKITWEGQTSYRNQAYAMELDSGTLSRTGLPGRRYLTKAPKGKELYFIGSGGKGNVIYRARADGSEPRELYGTSLRLEALTLSRDGRRAIFLRQVEAYSSLYEICLLHLVTKDVKRVIPQWGP